MAVSSGNVFCLEDRYYKLTADDAHCTGAVNEIAWACVEDMSGIATGIGCDISDLWLARRRKRLHADC